MPKFLLLVYVDPDRLDALPPGEYDGMMRHCLGHADELRGNGKLLDARMLEDPPTARSLRVRDGRVKVTDGPFSETKEVLGGFNLIEAADMDEAVRMAMEFPWARVGCIEVRPVRDSDVVARRVGHAGEEAGLR